MRRVLHSRGEIVRAAKRYSSHGAVLRLVEWEARVPLRTAQTYMTAKSQKPDKGATVAHRRRLIICFSYRPLRRIRLKFRSRQ